MSTTARRIKSHISNGYVSFMLAAMKGMCVWFSILRRDTACGELVAVVEARKWNLEYDKQ
jgi:hypothetical protein